MSLRIAAQSLVIAVVAAAAIGLAHGENTADLSRASCADLGTLSRSDRLQLMAFLYAFYAGAAQRPVVDPARMESAAQAMGDLCDKEPSTPLIGDRARAIFLGAGGMPVEPGRAASDGGRANSAPAPTAPADNKPRVQ
jgi:hypothetical protein